jgi:TIR domain
VLIGHAEWVDSAHPKIRVDVFISYAGPDRPWAEWPAWRLEQDGVSVELAAWEWSAGANFVPCGLFSCYIEFWCDTFQATIPADRGGPKGLG